MGLFADYCGWRLLNRSGGMWFWQGRDQGAVLLFAPLQPEGLAGVFCVLGYVTVSCEWSTSFIVLLSDMPEGVNCE